MTGKQPKEFGEIPEEVKSPSIKNKRDSSSDSDLGASPNLLKDLNFMEIEAPIG